MGMGTRLYDGEQKKERKVASVMRILRVSHLEKWDPTRGGRQTKDCTQT